MDIKIKLITYSVLMIIVLLFLWLGFSSVGKIKSTKINPKVYFTAKIIDTGTSLISDSEDLYKLIERTAWMNPNKTIIIEDNTGEKEELTQLDLTYDKIEKLNKKIKSEKSAIKKIENYKDLESLQNSAIYFYEASDITSETCEDILYNLEEEDSPSFLMPNKDEYIDNLGKDAIKIKKLIQKSRKGLKN